MTLLRVIVRVWMARWGVLRLAIAGFLLWTLAADAGARLARLQLAALPGFDYAAEVSALRERGRYGEALVIADAGLEWLKGDAHTALASERAAVEAEQSSYLRRAKDVGMGALSGRGQSLEGLIGALAADFFVVGDVRDLLIEGTKLALDGDADELILVLSGVGVVTTLAPQIDWVPSLLKAGARAGAITKGLRESLIGAIRGKRTAEVAGVMGSVAVLARKASPAGALRIMAHADDAPELARLAAFVERRSDGAFALHVTGRDGARLVIEGGQAAETLVPLAARKGRAGVSFLRSPAAKALLKPHPIVGLLKGLRKGTIGDAVARAIERLDPAAWWLVPLLAAWCLLEAVWLVRRLATARAASSRASPATPAR